MLYGKINFFFMKPRAENLKLQHSFLKLFKKQPLSIVTEPGALNTKNFSFFLLNSSFENSEKLTRFIYTIKNTRGQQQYRGKSKNSKKWHAFALSESHTCHFQRQKNAAQALSFYRDFSAKVSRSLPICMPKRDVRRPSSAARRIPSAIKAVRILML